MTCFWCVASVYGWNLTYTPVTISIDFRQTDHICVLHGTYSKSLYSTSCKGYYMDTQCSLWYTIVTVFCCNALWDFRSVLGSALPWSYPNLKWNHPGWNCTTRHDDYFKWSIFCIHTLLYSSIHPSVLRATQYHLQQALYPGQCWTQR